MRIIPFLSRHEIRYINNEIVRKEFSNIRRTDFLSTINFVLGLIPLSRSTYVVIVL